MSIFWRFVLAIIIAVIAILVAIILGDYGPWYLSWLLGTGFMILVAALGGILFEEQEEAALQKSNEADTQKSRAPQRQLEY
ncbi:hypothetical protein ACFQ3K_06690 [Brucella gallinifaecis]|uniref:Uncharacterized protein n=1 Tax=Brucella gallinifaecis TaxID=215590 RepID=A0A502BL21_9HYPH|nr:hypothetical protein [Brucella gallinifaecis]TPF74351.1 hypothetical protein FHY56_14670 [Brucella gallinifaecis]